MVNNEHRIGQERKRGRFATRWCDEILDGVQMMDHSQHKKMLEVGVEWVTTYMGC